MEPIEDCLFRSRDANSASKKGCRNKETVSGTIIKESGVVVFCVFSVILGSSGFWAAPGPRYTSSSPPEDFDAPSFVFSGAHPAEKWRVLCSTQNREIEQ